MRALLLSLLLCLATAGALFAGDIAPEDAAKHVGEKVTVRGIVVEVYVSKGGNAYLNFGAAFPNQTFSADVLVKKTPQLLADGAQWLKDLEGKDVAVTGTVALYKGKPEIVLGAKEDVILSK